MSQLPIRPATPGEPGARPFIDWLDERVGGNRRLRERLTVFCQQWCHVRDDLLAAEGREPTADDYAERWGVANSSAFRILDEFRDALAIDYPGELCEVLWDAMPKWTGSGPVPRPMWILAAPVVPVNS